MSFEKGFQFLGAVIALGTVAVIVGSTQTANILASGGRALESVIRAAVSPVTRR